MNFQQIKADPSKWPAGLVSHIQNAGTLLAEWMETGADETLEMLKTSTEDLYVFIRQNNIQWDEIKVNALMREAMPVSKDYIADDYLNCGLLPNDDFRVELASLCAAKQIPMNVLTVDGYNLHPNNVLKENGVTLPAIPHLYARIVMVLTLQCVHVGTQFDTKLEIVPSELRNDVIGHLKEYANDGHPAALIFLRRLNETLSSEIFEEIMEEAKSRTCGEHEIIQARDKMNTTTEFCEVPRDIAITIGKLAREDDEPAQVWLGRALEIASNAATPNQVGDDFIGRYEAAMSTIGR